MAEILQELTTSVLVLFLYVWYFACISYFLNWISQQNNKIVQLSDILKYKLWYIIDEFI